MKTDIRKQVREKIAALLTAAFGLVAALAWNGAIRAIFTRIFGTADTVVGMLTYAIVVTILKKTFTESGWGRGRFLVHRRITKRASYPRLQRVIPEAF